MELSLIKQCARDSISYIKEGSNFDIFNSEVLSTLELRFWTWHWLMWP